VLDTLAYAERELLEAQPAFKRAAVLVHLASDVEVRTQTWTRGFGCHWKMKLSKLGVG
jgi:hypothetical protein